MYAPTSTNSPRSGPTSGDDDALTDFDGAGEILRAWGNGLRPDPDLTVSEWADRHRMLSGRASAEPGRYRTVRTPYMREIMDRLSPGDPTQRIVFMKAAQVGATEAGNNWIGFAIHQAPGPMLAVQPTVELAKRNSRQRIDPLIDESPELRERVKPARSRDAGNTMLSKEFAGGILIMTGANSAVGLRSHPGAVHLPRRGRRLSGLGRRGRRSGHAGRGAVADLRPQAQGVPCLDPYDPRALPDRAGVRGLRPAPVLRAVPALRRDAMAALRAAALGEGAARDGRVSLRGLRTAHRGASQDEDARARRVARDRHGHRSDERSVITFRRSTRRWAGSAGSGSRGAHEAARGSRRGDAGVPEHDPRRDLDGNRRGTRLAAAGRPARGMDAGYGARARPVPDRGRRRGRRTGSRSTSGPGVGAWKAGSSTTSYSRAAPAIQPAGSN